MPRKLLSATTAVVLENVIAQSRNVSAPSPSPCAHACSAAEPRATPQFSWQLLACIVILVMFVLLVCVLAAFHRRLRPMVSAAASTTQRKKADLPPIVCVTGVFVLQPDNHQDLAICTMDPAEKVVLEPDQKRRAVGVSAMPNLDVGGSRN